MGGKNIWQDFYSLTPELPTFAIWAKGKWQQTRKNNLLIVYSRCSSCEQALNH